MGRCPSAHRVSTREGLLTFAEPIIETGYRDFDAPDEAADRVRQTHRALTISRNFGRGGSMGSRGDLPMYTRRIGLGLVMLLAVGCSGDAFSAGDAGDGNEAGNAPPTGGGGDDAGVEGSTPPPPPGCDVSKLPTDDVCVVNDAEGVFVSSSLGTATGDGTQAHPLVSLDAAVTLAKSAQKRVYACAETYAEQIHLQEGTSVFGYFTCTAGWVIGATHAAVKAPASPAAVASNIVAPTRVEAVDIVAPDSTSQAQSSIALIGSGSPGLTVTHSTIHAGTGGSGESGVDGIQLTDSGSAKNGANSWADGVCNGCSALTLLYDTREPAGGTNTCVGAPGYAGGPGGSGGTGGEYQANGWGTWTTLLAVAVGNPTTPSTQTAEGGTYGIGGSAGAAGANGSNGTSGSTLGIISASGYATSDGTSATSGAPGQGGGGAGGYSLSSANNYPASSYPNYYGWGEPGAGGGAGGCPGLAATLGTGGGASIAVIAIQSPFTLDTDIIESSAGGAGGSAGAPSAPTSGGIGGKPAYYTGYGGNGGAGGNAGVSGNGGGGPSLGMAYQGTEPTLLASNITVGVGGVGVAQRAVNGETIPASPAGLSASTYAF
jgi:hypothetical protein